MNGSGTRSSLMYETIRIVQKLKPKYVIWENVKNLLSKKHRHNFDNYLDKMSELGYKNYYQVLNAKDYEIPQNRERVFTISIRQDIEKEFAFPKKQELKLRLKDMLESNVDEKYYLSDKMKNYIVSEDDKYKVNKDLLVVNRDIACSKTTREGNTRADTSDYICEKLESTTNLQEECLKIRNNTKQGYLKAHEGDGVYTNISTKRGTVTPQAIHTITSVQDCGVVVACAERGRENGQQLEISNREYSNAITSVQKDAMVKENLRIRKLTPREWWRLMGFNDDEFEKAEKTNSNSQLYKQAGNSIVVNVLEGILKNLIGDKQ